MGIPELTTAFNAHFGLDKSCAEIRSTLKNHKLKCGRTTGELQKGKSLIFTADQVRFIKQQYKNYRVADLTQELNRIFAAAFTVSQVKAFTRNHRITSGRTGKFESGSMPWNYGTKGVMKANSGNFKPGGTPANKRPLWSERIGSKDGLVLIKVPETDPYTGFKTRYKHKHVWVWEQANGPVPEGFAVAFKDSDKRNSSIDNLMLLSRAELLSLNLHGYSELPVELKPVVLTLAKIEAVAGFRTRPGRGRAKKG